LHVVSDVIILKLILIISEGIRPTPSLSATVQQENMFSQWSQ